MSAAHEHPAVIAADRMMTDVAEKLGNRRVSVAEYAAALELMCAETLAAAHEVGAQEDRPDVVSLLAAMATGFAARRKQILAAADLELMSELEAPDDLSGLDHS